MSPLVQSLLFNRHFWLSIPFFLFSLGLGLTGLVIGGRASDLARDGVETVAEVLARETWSTRGSAGGPATVHHQLTVRFLDTALEPVVLDLPAPQTLYDSVAAGDRIPVRHLPEDPETAELVAGTTAIDAAGFGQIALVMALAGVFFLGRAGFAAWRRR